MLTKEEVRKIQVAVLAQAVQDYADSQQRDDVRRFLSSPECEYLFNPFYGSLSFAEILDKLGG